MAKRRARRYSGIGGQAVLEGVMMKNKDIYAVSVRKPDGSIETDVETYQGILHGGWLTKVPFVRGVFSFIDSLVLGMKTLTWSSRFYGEDEEESQDGWLNRLFGARAESIMTGCAVVLAILLAVGIFIVLPYFISLFLARFVRNDSLLAIIEGAIRLLLFLGYVAGISLMKDIRRLYQYHGAEHKCINCIEKGRPLTVHDVMRSSRLHRRCGTSFLLFVLVISIILFFFIRVESPVWRLVLRLLLIPVIAGISYEILRLAGRSDNFLMRIISAPGLLLQRLTTKEPDESMVEVAIASVEAVFDWKAYLKEAFGYEVDDTW